MVGYIKRDVEQRTEHVGLNLKINREVFNSFKDYCKKRGYPMNVMLESFMQQYANGRFQLNSEEINKWKGVECEIDILNTTIDKTIHKAFKSTCKGNGYFLRHVLMAFMAKLVSTQYNLEFAEVGSKL